MLCAVLSDNAETDACMQENENFVWYSAPCVRHGNLTPYRENAKAASAHPLGGFAALQKKFGYVVSSYELKLPSHIRNWCERFNRTLDSCHVMHMSVDLEHIFPTWAILNGSNPQTFRLCPKSGAIQLTEVAMMALQKKIRQQITNMWLRDFWLKPDTSKLPYQQRL